DDAAVKARPRQHGPGGQLGVDPGARRALEEKLEALAIVANRGPADGLELCGGQAGREGLEQRVAGVLVEGRLDADFAESHRRVGTEAREEKLGALELAGQAPRVDTVESLAGCGEVLAHEARLLATQLGELVVVVGAERSLSVTNQVNDAH